MALVPSATPSKETLMPSLKSSLAGVTPLDSSSEAKMAAWTRTWTLTTLSPALGWGLEWAGSLAPSTRTWVEWVEWEEWEEWGVTAAL